MGSQTSVQDDSIQLIEFDPDIKISVIYLYQDNLCGIEQDYKVNGKFQLDDFIKYLESIGSIPKFKENQVCISSIQIDTKEYLKDESRNFRQLNLREYKKLIIKLQALDINNQQRGRVCNDIPELLQIDESDLLINDCLIELQFQIFQILGNNSQNIIAKQKPFIQNEKTPELLQNDEGDLLINNGQIELQFQSFLILGNNSQNIIAKQKPFIQNQKTPEVLQNDESDLLINNGQTELQFQSFQILGNNSQNILAKQKPIIKMQKISFKKQNSEKPINTVQIQTQVHLTQTEKSILEEINNAPSLIKQNMINVNPIEYQKNQELLKIIKQEEEVLLENFQCQQNQKKQEDKSFKIIEQQKYHKIENAIKRRIVENQKSNQIINPLNVNQQQVLQDKNQELIMFVLADQMKNSGKVLYQSKESEKLNIFSLQASFSDQCEDTICEKLTLQETPQLTFNQLRDDNIQEKQFYTSIREILAKQYNVRPEEVNILSIESGSIKVLYKITGNYSDSDKEKKYTMNELNRLFPGSSPVLALHKYFESLQLSPDDFDPNHNQQWINFAEFELRGPPQDQIKYFFPKGWNGYALKVKGKYDNGNDDWLLMNSNPNQWHIMYHGTTNLGCKGIQQTGFRAGAGQGYSSHTDIRFNQIIGNGIYFSNHIEVCEGYCRQTTIIDNHHYKVAFMSRVRPTSLKQVKKQSDIAGKQGNLDWDNDYFVVNKPEDIRPYRILLKKF